MESIALFLAKINIYSKSAVEFISDISYNQCNENV